MDVRRLVEVLPARPRLADALLASAVAAGSLSMMLTVRGSDHHRPDIVGALAIFGAAVPLVWRRTQPVGVLAVVTAFEFLGAGMNYSGTGWTAMLVAAYSLGA